MAFGIWESLLIVCGVLLIALIVMIICICKCTDSSKEQSENLNEKAGIPEDEDIESNKPPIGHAQDNKKSLPPDTEEIKPADAITDHDKVNKDALALALIHKNKGESKQTEATPKQHNEHLLFPGPPRSPRLVHSDISSPMTSDYDSEKSLTPVNSPSLQRAGKGKGPMVLIRNIKVHMSPALRSKLGKENREKIARI